ncbi:hypothetical protein BOTBODRAFT_53640 [Botryobasidium botryosum FD-172 SS1]|uniref:Uncharacterized protein n=1 Tax=Botryobasidium botryosum (strain FD-172 SS1) TaxID=930990 RepID=A0A067MZQ4_BOTB1|nr:hypothetical protein BOTBODRAFT_53640 [Botryobasidium botryosum FD-172 SS1]
MEAGLVGIYHTLIFFQGSNDVCGIWFFEEVASITRHRLIDYSLTIIDLPNGHGALKSEMGISVWRAR